MLEIMEHLVVAEQVVMQPWPPRRRRVRDIVRYALVLFVLRLRIRVQVPSPKMLPTGTRSFDEIRAMSEENQRGLERYVAEASAADLRSAIFRHPVAGPLTIARALQLDQVHFDRHRRQIEALA